METPDNVPESEVPATPTAASPEVEESTRAAADLGAEQERMLALAVKFPEIGPTLASLAYKAGWKGYADRVVATGLAGGPRGAEYYLIAAENARREGQPNEVLTLAREAVRELGARPELSRNDGARLLQLVRKAFSALLFDLKDPRADLDFVSALAEQWGELEPKLNRDPLFHVLRAQILWYADPEAAEAAWDAAAAETPDPELLWNARGTWAKDAAKDIAAAEKAYRAGVEMAPQSALLLHNLAQLLMDRAMALPTPAEGEENSPSARARARDLNQAEEFLRRALRGDARGVRRHVHATLDRLMALKPARNERRPRPPREARRGDAPGTRNENAAPAEPPPPPPPPAPPPAAGETVTGRAVSITDFGVFVQFPGGHVGLLHRTELTYERIEDLTTVVKVGENIEVKVLSVGEGEEGGKRRISLSRKALLPAPERSAESRGPRGDARGPGGPGGGPPRGDRGPRRDGGGGGGGGGGPPRGDRGPRPPRPEGEAPRAPRPPRLEGEAEGAQSARPPRPEGDRGPRGDGPRGGEGRGPRPEGDRGGDRRDRGGDRGDRGERPAPPPQQAGFASSGKLTIGEMLLAKIRDLEAEKKK
jgi:predicted RNA-binding protein with RPS1 domain